MVEVGQQAPDFELPAHDGERVALSQFKGQKWVVLSAYPAAFTSG
jgi:peroxiredoxin Q/BCP